MDTLSRLEAEAVTKAAEKVRRKEEKAALQIVWEAEKRKWQRKRDNLRSHGLKVSLAGPRPLLKNMKLPCGQGLQQLSPTPPSSPIMKVQARGCQRTSLDSIEEDFIIWDSEQSDTVSEGYSLYDNSDDEL